MATHRQSNIYDLERLLSSETDTAKIVCKFVIMRNETDLALVLGSVRNFPYHAHLVNAYCDRLGIPAAWVKKPDLIEVLIPDVVVEGGGWLEIDGQRLSVSFHGKSTAYGTYDRCQLETMLVDCDSLERFSIYVD